MSVKGAPSTAAWIQGTTVSRRLTQLQRTVHVVASVTTCLHKRIRNRLHFLQIIQV